MRRSWILALSLFSGAFSTASASDEPAISADVEAMIKGALKPTIDPCQDFYAYACGGWMETSQIPSDRTSWYRSFSTIDEKNEKLLQGILDEAAKGSSDPELARVGKFYAACNDEAAINTRGVAPLRALFAPFDAVSDSASLAKAVGMSQQYGAGPLFGMYVDADYKDPNKAILYVFQGGLGMPDRDYYLKDDDETKQLRTQYLKTIETLLTLAGEKGAAKEAKAIFAFEMELARIQKPQDELQDPEKTYNKLDLAGLQKLTPNFPWDSFFAAAGGAGKTDISVADPEYFTKLDALVKKTGPKKLKSYLKYQLILATAEHLTTEIHQADFAFFGQALTGQKELKPRWKQCLDATSTAFPEIVGRYYVDKAFSGESKEQSLEMIRNIETAFEGNLAGLEWMDDGTRARAAEKMKMIVNKIGYPDQWRDYSSVSTDAADHLGNVLAARKFENDRQFKKIGQPSERGEWFMAASDVNAYYNPTFNEMAFPAGILQAPFFDRNWPLAFNYGGIGMVMGHELTHGFDDSGRKFDGSGQMVEWWDPAVAARFEERTKCVVDLYNGFEVAPGLMVNGELTLGENIADLGGLKQSYQAFKSIPEKVARPAVAGLTQDQQFFVGYAQAWCTLRTPAMDRLYATVDAHSPPKYRVNGAVSQFPEFGKAFNCPVGSPMRPEKVCEVW